MWGAMVGMAGEVNGFDGTELLLSLGLAVPAAGLRTPASTGVILICWCVHAQRAQSVDPDDVEAHIAEVTHRRGG
jgi:hypothetical protein